MPQIINLSPIGEVLPGDSLPIFDESNGDTRRMSVGQLSTYMEATLSLPDNAADIDYDPAGTGAVTRSVQSKLRETVSVKDFGAVGDGVTDDTVPINRAAKYLANIGGGTVYYPPGTYRITRAIRLDNYDIETFTYSGPPRRNIVHQGAGRDSTIIKASGFWTSIFTNFPEPFIPNSAILPDEKGANEPGVVPSDEYIFWTENVVIDGFTLDCDYDTNVDGGAAYGSHYASWGGTWPNGTTGASLWAADNYQYPIYAKNTQNISVTNCRIRRTWYNGVEIYRCHDVTIKDNILENCGDKANYLGHYSAAEFDNASLRCVFDQNIVKTCGNGVMANGDTLGYVWRAVSEVLVSNNIFDTITNSGIFAFDWISDWTVSNNTFISIGSGAILFALNATPVAGRHPQYCKISDNLIREFNLLNAAGTTAIRALGHGHTVTGNSVFQESSSVTNNTAAIVVQEGSVTIPAGSSQSCVVANNMLSGRFPGSDENNSVITCLVKNAQVSGNLIRSISTVAQVAIGIAGDDVNVQNNAIQGTWQYASGKRAIYRASGARPNIRDNRFQPLLDVRTGAGRSGLSGWNVVDFTNYTPTTYDNRGNFNTGTNAFVADIPGLYRLTAQLRFAGVGTAASPVSVSGLFERNGSTSFGYSAALSPGNVDLNFSTLIELNAGDSMTLKSYCGSTYTVESETNMHVEFVQQRT